MKKILVSDYDRTLHQDDDMMKLNELAIKKFRENNIFVIATGRSYEDFMRAYNKYNIKSDYYILNHGSVILDSKFNLLYKKTLEKEDIDTITKFFDSKKVNIKYCSCYKNDCNIDDEIFKVVAYYSNYNDLVSDYNLFRKGFNYYTFLLKNHCSFEIINGSTNKMLAIKRIEEFENNNNIYVIGDSLNDIEMIKEYNGFCVSNACLEVKKVSKKIYDSVYNLIDELLEDEV